MIREARKVRGGDLPPPPKCAGDGEQVNGGRGGPRPTRGTHLQGSHRPPAQGGGKKGRGFSLTLITRS
eukprot:14344356-Alexandrium_andersonii.AAC.1